MVEDTPAPLRYPDRDPDAGRLGASADRFSNGQAVRIGLQPERWRYLLGNVRPIAGAQAFALIWLVAGGFLTVFLYKRRTGQRISMLNGAHLGWICGVFAFVIVTIMLTSPQ